ncbi:reverse transcriptase domain-containing protein [Tanacetum coccineum]
MSGPEPSPVHRRSWCVEGRARSGVISSVLMHRYQRTLRQSYSPCEEPQSLLGDEGLSSGGTKMHSFLSPLRREPKKAWLTRSLWRRNLGEQKQGTQDWKPRGTYRTCRTTAKNPSPSPAFIKENSNVLRTIIKEHDQQAKMKATPRKLAYADSNKEAPDESLARGFSDRFSLESSGTSETHKRTRSTGKSQRTPSKNKELAHLRRSRRLEDRSITKKKARRERSKPRGKRSGHQERSSDFKGDEGGPNSLGKSEYMKETRIQRIIRYLLGGGRTGGMTDAHLVQDVWPNPGGATRNWFDDLDPKSVDSFEELSQKFLEEFSQQKRYAKDPTEIHGNKRRQNEGLQAFIDRFKYESSHIKGVPPVLRISAFMHGHGHPELAKKLNEKIPKTVDEMFERVKAFIRREVAAGSAEMVRPSQGDKGYVCSVWTGVPEKARSKGGLREAQRTMGVYTHYPRKDTFTPLIKTPKEILAMETKKANRGSRVLGEVGSSSEGHPSKLPAEQLAEWESGKERCEGHKHEGIIEGNQVRRILVDGGSSAEIMYEHYFRNLHVNIRSRLRRCGAPMIGFSGETYLPMGVIDLRVPMGREGRSKTVLIEFAIIKCRSPYDIIIRRTKMRSLGAVGSTIHSMIKFPTNQRVVTMETSRETLRECKRLERVQVPVSLEKTRGGEDAEEVFNISHERPDQYVMMGTTLTTNCKQLLEDVLRENMEVFTWTRSERTAVPRFIMEHQLKIYPLAEPMVHKRRPMAPEGRLALKEKVFRWLKEGLIRKVSYEGKSILFHPYARRIKELCRYTSENDVEGLSRSKGTKCGNILGRNAISKFIPKLAELKCPIREAQTRLETAKGYGWTNEDEEALRRIKRKLGKLQTMAIPKKGEVLMLCLRQRNETISYVLLGASTNSHNKIAGIFRKHKVKVVTDGPMGEILKLSRREGRLGKWAA